MKLAKSNIRRMLRRKHLADVIREARKNATPREPLIDARQGGEITHIEHEAVQCSRCKGRGCVDDYCDGLRREELCIWCEGRGCHTKVCIRRAPARGAGCMIEYHDVSYDGKRWHPSGPEDDFVKSVRTMFGRGSVLPPMTETLHQSGQQIP